MVSSNNEDDGDNELIKSFMKLRKGFSEKQELFDKKHSDYTFKLLGKDIGKYKQDFLTEAKFFAIASQSVNILCEKDNQICINEGFYDEIILYHYAQKGDKVIWDNSNKYYKNLPIRGYLSNRGYNTAEHEVSIQSTSVSSYLDLFISPIITKKKIDKEDLVKYLYKVYTDNEEKLSLNKFESYLDFSLQQNYDLTYIDRLELLAQTSKFFNNDNINWGNMTWLSNLIRIKKILNKQIFWETSGGFMNCFLENMETNSSDQNEILEDFKELKSIKTNYDDVVANLIINITSKTLEKHRSFKDRDVNEAYNYFNKWNRAPMVHCINNPTNSKGEDLSHLSVQQRLENYAIKVMNGKEGGGS